MAFISISLLNTPLSPLGLKLGPAEFNLKWRNLLLYMNYIYELIWENFLILKDIRHYLF